MNKSSCSPCSVEGTRVDAEIYCVDCDQHLCGACLKQHNRFDVMKSHQMFDRIETVDNTKIKGVIPSQRCSVHHMKLVDMYCEHHDEACCVACVAVYHGYVIFVQYFIDSQ